MEYAHIRLLHIGCAALSITLFLARWGLGLGAIDWRKQRWLRVLPHANDTVLLGAAITLAAWSHQYPWQQAWLAAKVLLLVLYVALGHQALRAFQPLAHRLLWGAAALATVSSIVAIAITRRPALAF